MKIVCVDNFARETKADRLVASGVNEVEGTIMVKALCATCDAVGPNWYILKDDDYRLSRGMEDLI